MSDPTPTPNIHLQPINANRRTWADLMNNNLKILDAVVGTYFSVQDLRGVWTNSTAYAVGDSVVDPDTSGVFRADVAHTSPTIPTTFLESRTANPTYWVAYSSVIRARGAWQPDTTYNLNEIVISGSQYAACLVAHTSSSSFATDLAAGKWSILIDLAIAGSTVMPVPSGLSDANKFAVINTAGTGYTIVAPTDALTLLGATTIGTALLQATSEANALSIIGAQPAGSYQPLADVLTLFSAVALGGQGTTLTSNGSTFKYVLGSINVKTFGAVGDGVTNDTTAIQAAIDFMEAIGGGTVYFPAGTYSINATLTRNKSVRLLGDGWQTDSSGSSGAASGAFSGSQLLWAGGASAMIRTISGTAANYLIGASIEGLYLDGANTATYGAHESSVKNSTYDISARRCVTAGLRIDDGNGALAHFNNITLEYNYGTAVAVRGSHGLMLDGSASNIGCTQNNIYHITGLVKNGWLVYLKDCDGNHFFSVQGSRDDSGATGGTGTGGVMKFHNGASAAHSSRNNLIDVFWGGRCYMESECHSNVFLKFHSEGGFIEADSGAQWHAVYYDYQTDGRWTTHSYLMTDKKYIPATALNTDIEYTGTVVRDLGSLADGASEIFDITVTGALVGDFVKIAPSADVEGLTITGFVRATNTVEATALNGTGGVVDLGSMTFRANVRGVRAAFRGDAAALWPAVIMPDGYATVISAVLCDLFPWNSGTITGIILHHSQSTTNSGDNVAIRLRAITTAAGVSISSPDKDQSYEVAVNDAAERYTQSTLSFSSAMTYTRGDFLAFRIDRLGSDVLDTAAGNLQVHGITVLYEGTGPASSGSGPFPQTLPGT